MDACRKTDGKLSSSREGWIQSRGGDRNSPPERGSHGDAGDRRPRAWTLPSRVRGRRYRHPVLLVLSQGRGPAEEARDPPGPPEETESSVELARPPHRGRDR